MPVVLLNEKTGEEYEVTDERFAAPYLAAGWQRVATAVDSEPVPVALVPAALDEPERIEDEE